LFKIGNAAPCNKAHYPTLSGAVSVPEARRKRSIFGSVKVAGALQGLAQYSQQARYGFGEVLVLKTGNRDGAAMQFPVIVTPFIPNFCLINRHNKSRLQPINEVKSLCRFCYLTIANRPYYRVGFAWQSSGKLLNFY
jgi:hypothetical protein